MVVMVVVVVVVVGAVAVEATAAVAGCGGSCSSSRNSSGCSIVERVTRACQLKPSSKDLKTYSDCEAGSTGHDVGEQAVHILRWRETFPCRYSNHRTNEALAIDLCQLERAEQVADFVLAKQYRMGLGPWCTISMELGPEPQNPKLRCGS